MARNEFGMEGPDQGWEEPGPSGSGRGGSDRNTTNATAPPKTRRAQNLRPPNSAASRRANPPETDIWQRENWAPIVPRGYLNEPTREPLAEQATQIGGARPPRCRLLWFHDRGRENPSICAAAERWPLRAAKWPRPIRLWTPTCPAAGFSAAAAGTPTHGTRRRRDRSSGRISGISAGSGLDYPLQQQRLEQRRSSCWRPRRIVQPGVH